MLYVRNILALSILCSCTDYNCIDIVFCYCFVLGTAQSCVLVAGVFVVSSVCVVYGIRHHELRYRSDEARSIEYQSQEPATCCTRVRATARSYIVCVWLSTLFWLCLGVFLVTMDRLPSDKQELLRKSSTERLRLKLLHIGWEEEEVLALDRAEFLEAAAEVTLVAERSETVIKETLPASGNSPGSSAASDAVRLRELELDETHGA